jgi:hypothetical protein
MKEACGYILKKFLGQCHILAIWNIDAFIIQAETPPLLHESATRILLANNIKPENCSVRVEFCLHCFGQICVLWLLSGLFLQVLIPSETTCTRYASDPLVFNNYCCIFNTIPDDGTYVYGNMSGLCVNVFYAHFIKSVHVLVSCSTIPVTTCSVWII